MVDIECEALHRRYEKLAKDFEEQHPAKWASNQFVNRLIDAARTPDDVVSSAWIASASGRRPSCMFVIISFAMYSNRRT